MRLLQGNRGRLTASEIGKWIMPDDVHFPVTQLISLEDTANRGGGAVYDFKEIEAISRLAKDRDIPLHLDGARVFNALAVNEVDLKVYASQFDSISICLSKGLGAPVGSLLLGTKEFIHRARRVRKVMGGGMRQAGFLAAAGLFALKNNVERLKEDHRRAKELEQAFLNCDWIAGSLAVETNILVVILKDESKRDLYIRKLGELGVKVSAFGPGMIRLVTHLDISDDQVRYSIEQLRKI